MKRKNILLTLITILLISVILFCSTETVMSQNKTYSARCARYYDAMEEEYRSSLEKTLDEKGFANSGVNIRWISNDDGTRAYTVIINHRRINSLDGNGRDKLLHEFAELEFKDEGCSFSYSFLYF